MCNFISWKYYPISKRYVFSEELNSHAYIPGKRGIHCEWEYGGKLFVYLYNQEKRKEIKESILLQYPKRDDIVNFGARSILKNGRIPNPAVLGNEKAVCFFADFAKNMVEYPYQGHLESFIDDIKCLDLQSVSNIIDECDHIINHGMLIHGQDKNTYLLYMLHYAIISRRIFLQGQDRQTKIVANHDYKDADMNIGISFTKMTSFLRISTPDNYKWALNLFKTYFDDKEK